MKTQHERQGIKALRAVATRLWVWGVARHWITRQGAGRAGRYRTETPMGTAEQRRAEGLAVGSDDAGRFARWNGTATASGEMIARLPTDVDQTFVDELFQQPVLVRQADWRPRDSARPDRVKVSISGNGPSVWLEAERDSKGNVSRALLKASDWDGIISEQVHQDEATLAGLRRAAEAAFELG